MQESPSLHWAVLVHVVATGPQVPVCPLHTCPCGQLTAWNEHPVAGLQLSVVQASLSLHVTPACWHPETRERADHSHPFLLALALTEGSVEVRHFEEGYYTHPEIVALMQKVQVQVGNEPEHQQAGPGMPTAVVEVDLHSGATLRMKQGFNAARAAYLRTDQGQEEKLRSMAEALLPKAQTDALFQSLRTLEQQRDIRAVLALTIAPKGKR